MKAPIDAIDDELDDPVLADWAAELANRIEAGEPVDLEAYARRDPDRADRLRRLLPAIEIMARISTLR